MTDIFSTEKRSDVMSKIKSENTKPEKIVRSLLFSAGYRFRLHSKELPGKPDIVLPKYKTVVFVNGCFWHGHENCKEGGIPKTNSQFWRDKILKNKERDERVSNELKQEGWKVLVVWECQLKDKERLLSFFRKELKTN